MDIVKIRNKNFYKNIKLFAVDFFILKVFDCSGVLGDISHRGRSCQLLHQVGGTILITLTKV